jgi:LytR cell envelope-related transcriptional attenuator
MVEQPEHGGRSSERPPRTGAGPVAGRALAVLALFVVVTATLLGGIHPVTASNALAPSTSSAPPSSVPSSTASSTGTTHRSSTTTAPPATTPPNKIPVLVANGSGATGAAGTVSNQLQVGGWDMLPPVNASARAATSSVYYVAGQQPAAKSIAAALHLPATAVAPLTSAVPVTGVGSAQIVVVVGSDLTAKSGITATTAAPVTTTTTTTIRAH